MVSYIMGKRLDEMGPEELRAAKVVVARLPYAGMTDDRRKLIPGVQFLEGVVSAISALERMEIPNGVDRAVADALASGSGFFRVTSDGVEHIPIADVLIAPQERPEP